jgi:uncharacterized membrane protein (UPF0127 family)
MLSFMGQNEAIAYLYQKKPYKASPRVQYERAAIAIEMKADPRHHRHQ